MLLLLPSCRANFETLLGPLLPQLEAAAKNYSGYRPNKQGVQVWPTAICSAEACMSASLMHMATCT
jgi:hypothetical protein